MRGFVRTFIRGSHAPTQSPELTIPVVDFSRFRHATSTSEKKDTAEKIANAFKRSGFIYLKEHGISESLVKNAFQKSAEFFAMSQEKKDALAWEDPRANRGYVTFGRERVTQSSDTVEIAALRAKAPDSKETMEIGRDWDSVWKNRWPKEKDVPDFKNTMLVFYQTCHELHTHLMSSIAIGLDLDGEFFANKIDQQCHNLRLLSYPPIKRSTLQEEGQARAGAHTDYGTLTLLFQDQVGGLEVQNPHTKIYQPASPIPGTIVVNVGDLLHRWSNDVLRSTLHRVVAPPAEKISSKEITPKRQSIAFFCNPNFDALIECLPSCAGKEDGSKYEPIGTEEYIVSRLSATYS